MKRKLLYLLILFSFLIGTPQANSSYYSKINIPAQETAVLICNSSYAYAYHTHYCRGLKKCKAEVKKISEGEAVKLGRKPCGYCYR